MGEPPQDTVATLSARLRELQTRLDESDELLHAIRCGAVDALVVTQQASGSWISRLETPDRPFRELIEQIGEVAVTLSGDGTLLYANGRLAEMLGMPPDQFVGQRLAELMLPEHGPALLQLLQDAKSKASRCELTLRRADGAQVPVYASLSVLQRDGGPTILCGVLTDLTQQRLQLRELECLAQDLAEARDKAELASKTKSRFLAGMSHELRTPLNGILGYAQMLRLEGGLNAVQGGRVDAMLGAGKHLLGMITSVLEMSQIEADQVTLHLVDVDIAEIAAECIDVIGSAAELKGLALRLCTLRGTPRRVTTDPTRLRQVMLNLLGNALKFTTLGSVELRLRAAAGGYGLRIEVADTGPGISSKLRLRLFQDFERLDTRANAVIEGSGLGLALSARLVTLLGGRIGHEDNPGGGSLFWLELPLPVPSVPPARASSDALPVSLDATSRWCVLVVDDVDMNREIARAFLSSAGHDVICVAGGAEAVVAAASGDYDVILMDVRMPEIDGLEATRRIRSLTGSRGLRPIIALTAQTFAEQVAECKEAGMDAHLSKPFTPEGLLQAIAHAVASGHASNPTGACDGGPTGDFATVSSFLI